MRKQVTRPATVLTLLALTVATLGGVLTSCSVTRNTTTKGKAVIITTATDTTVINHRGTLKFQTKK